MSGKIFFNKAISLINFIIDRGANPCPYCHTAYNGLSAFEYGFEYVTNPTQMTTDQLLALFTTYSSPQFDIAVPAQTDITFKLYLEGIEDNNYSFPFNDEMGLYHYTENNDLTRLTGINCDDASICSINNYSTTDDNADGWKSMSKNLSGVNSGLSSIMFAHVNHGGVGMGLDNILVYGPRCVEIPANVSAAAAGATVTTSESYYRIGCQQTTVQTQWYIKPKTSDTITVSHTGAYTWATPEGDGNSYSATGLYSKTGMTNSVGCDSTHYLDLTVMEELVRDTTVTHIDTCATAFTWDINHQTYTTSGTYYYQASELHWEALVLTLKSASPATTLSPNVCDTFTWSIDSNNKLTQIITYQSGAGVIPQYCNILILNETTLKYNNDGWRAEYTLTRVN